MRGHGDTGVFKNFMYFFICEVCTVYFFAGLGWLGNISRNLRESTESKQWQARPELQDWAPFRIMYSNKLQDRALFKKK